MGPPEGEILAIDTVSQNRLNTTKNLEVWRKFWKLGSKIPEVKPGGHLLRHSFRYWRALSYDILRSKIGIEFEKLLIFSLSLAFSAFNV